MTRDGQTAPIPVGEGEAYSATCDWGDCDRPTTCMRYDEWGHGWLTCCDECARKPVDFDGRGA